MRTNRLVILSIVIAASLWLAGCASQGDVAGSSTELKGGSATKMGVGDNVTQTGGTTVSDPASVKEGGSYKLAPANPDDPKFKADPKLGGGG